MADVVVAGSINMDVVASAPRHPQPGETVTGTALAHFPGGKGANQAVAAALAGATSRMVGAVGDDAAGGEMLRFLAESGVDTSAVARRAGTPTGTALIVVDASGENTIVVVPGANDTVDEETVRAAGIQAGDVLVAQHETPQATTAALFRHGRDVGSTCMLNPAPARPTPPEMLGLTDILVLNETELALLSTSHIGADTSEDEIADAVGTLLGLGLPGIAVVTLGARGALVIDGAGVLRVDSHDVDVVDTTGAGDCFVGSLAAEIAGGSSMQPALRFASAAAALCVTKRGAGPSMPTRAAVEDFLAERG
jgi:ribokinase